MSRDLRAGDRFEWNGRELTVHRIERETSFTRVYFEEARYVIVFDGERDGR